METTRKCTVCSTDQPIENFHFSHKSLGYRRHECNDCETERKNEWYNANHAEQRSKQNAFYHSTVKHRVQTPEFRERNAEYQKRYRDQMKDTIYDYYGRRCACCGETEPKFLTLDHMDNNGNAMRKHQGHPKGEAAFLSWIIKHDFPANLQILCMNCNMGKARNGGVCPHQKSSTAIPKGSTLKRVEVRRTPNKKKGDDMVSSVMKVAAA